MTNPFCVTRTCRSPSLRNMSITVSIGVWSITVVGACIVNSSTYNRWFHTRAWTKHSHGPRSSSTRQPRAFTGQRQRCKSPKWASLWNVVLSPVSDLKWLGDRKGIRSIKIWVLVCWWWHFDWSFACVTAPAVTITSIILAPRKSGMVDRAHLVPAYLGWLGKWPLNR